MSRQCQTSSSGNSGLLSVRVPAPLLEEKLQKQSLRSLPRGSSLRWGRAALTPLPRKVSCWAGVGGAGISAGGVGWGWGGGGQPTCAGSQCAVWGGREGWGAAVPGIQFIICQTLLPKDQGMRRLTHCLIPSEPPCALSESNQSQGVAEGNAF